MAPEHPVTPPQPPAAALIGHLRTELKQWPPFQDMPPAEVDAALARCEQRYLAAGEVLLEPAQGPADRLYLVRRGQVESRLGPQEEAFHYGPGDLLPIDALMSRRAVRATYRAADDVFVLTLTVGDVEAIANRSPVFAGFLRGRVATLLEKSRRALQESLTSQVLAEQGMETPLGALMRGQPVQCPPQATVESALQAMTAHQVGSVMVTDPQGLPLGILTRHDLPGLVLDPQFDLNQPIAQVMQHPVRSLDAMDTAQDAALLMGRHGFRHVPVTRGGRLVGIVSERDLFALQRGTLQQVSTAIRRARDLAALKAAAAGIRSFAQRLLAQGVQSRQATQLISHLNDLLTQQLLACEAGRAGVDLQGLCWVALGSEGRGEQTIATDQDNALVLPDATGPADRERLRQWADVVNHALDACGYPLCRGGVMAGHQAYCLRQGEWLDRLDRWIGHGSPQDLLGASIVFDMRGLAGDPRLLTPLLTRVTQQVARTPRFLHQMAVNALAHRPPLDWRGHASGDEAGGVDLKLQGTALFVDAARILGLAHGVSAASTRERLESAGQALGLQPSEYNSWTGAFEFLQGLRLRFQVTPAHSGSDNPNWLPIDRLSDIDQRILAASLREARRLQQRLSLDYLR